MCNSKKGFIVMIVQPFSSTLLTAEQADTIVSILVSQCNMIEEREKKNLESYPELYDEDYMSGRRHGYTASVLAGFQETTAIPQMSIKKKDYGRIHCQPELSSETSIIQIYSSKATLSIDEVCKMCAKYNSEGSEKRYGILQFWTSEKGHLTKVEIVELNESAMEINREIIYKYRASVRKLVA